MKVIVTSKNPIKVNATEAAFQKAFRTNVDIFSIVAESGVPDQPFSSEEALLGAKNRVKNSIEAVPEADYWVGIEAGVEPDGDELASFTWVFIKSKVKEGRAKSQTYFLPSNVAALVKQGKELGEAIDQVFRRKNSKQANGAIGILTNNLMTREEIYIENILLALIPFM